MAVGFRTDGNVRRVREVHNADAFVTAMNERPDVGRVAVVIQVKADEPGAQWIDIATVWEGEWDRHRKPPVPTRKDLLAVASKSGARWARTVIRSDV